MKTTIKKGDLVKINNGKLQNVHGHEGFVMSIGTEQARVRVMADDGDKTCWFDYSEIKVLDNENN